MPDPEPLTTAARCRAAVPPRWKRGWFWLGLGVLLSLGAAGVAYILTPHTVVSQGESRGLSSLPAGFSVKVFLPSGTARGVMVLGSGDGGWSYWEERVAKHLQSVGIAVAGWDTRAYAAATRYDAKTLARGFAEAAEDVRQSVGGSRLPVIYGGWSTGAEQSLPAAADPTLVHPDLVGLCLVSPGSRGRFGLEKSDLMGVTPTGPGTWALGEFGPALERFKIAQLAAGIDPLDDVDWLSHHPGTHRLFEMPRMLHDFDGASPRFFLGLDEALIWLAPSLSPLTPISSAPTLSAPSGTPQPPPPQ
jgi:Bacterial virulence protein (VirJ)